VAHSTTVSVAQAVFVGVTELMNLKGCNVAMPNFGYYLQFALTYCGKSRNALVEIVGFLDNTNLLLLTKIDGSVPSIQNPAYFFLIQSEITCVLVPPLQKFRFLYQILCAFLDLYSV
jgi:hypothetical protein